MIYDHDKKWKTKHMKKMDVLLPRMYSTPDDI